MMDYGLIIFRDFIVELNLDFFFKFDNTLPVNPQHNSVSLSEKENFFMSLIGYLINQFIICATGK